MFRTQKDTIRKGIQNNAGFTLIEMIVSVAICNFFRRCSDIDRYGLQSVQRCIR